ncbi:MAG: hypothetical protein Q8903_11920, partial [Bacteroidota bacterium]|nr:hypothetical protein [Bacteroidota bacterium]
MKKYILIIFLTMQSFSFAQIDWLPLSIGNEYQYNQEHQYYHFGKITKDTVVNGKTYYDFSDVIWMLNFYLREDSLGNIYTLHSQYIDTNYVDQPEYLLFPYDSKEGDDWVIARHKYYSWADLHGHCTLIDSAIVIGKVRHIRNAYIINHGTVGFTFAEGVGIVEWGFETTDNILNYAKIGKETYGTLVGVNDKKPVPDEYMLLQNYPNPFNPNTTISYSLAKSGPVTLKIYDL